MRENGISKRVGIIEKIFLLVIAMLFLCVPLLFACNYLRRSYKSEQFVDHWSSEFLKCPDLASITRNFPGTCTREFENGEWVAVSSACRDRDGYDVSFLRQQRRNTPCQQPPHF
jgi:hypothetical protein